VLTRIHHLLGIELDQDQWPKHWPDEATPPGTEPATSPPPEGDPQSETRRFFIDPVTEEEPAHRPLPTDGSRHSPAQGGPGVPDDSS
jgi:hypothetical protein